MKRLLTLTTLLILATPLSAMAWTATTEGPDVFGNTKVFASSGGRRDTLVVQCDQKEQLLIAIIYPKKKFENIPEAPATLLIKASDGAPVSLSANMRSWNDNFYGVSASGRTKELVGIVRAIGAAKRKIQVGIEVGGIQQSSTFSSRGSTKAMNKVIKGCKLDQITE